ncbi:hypothetical protein ACFPMF_26755 [Larkinella bovis]|uniref:Uncharacterized protein n=1 Tax=Larkinella bovis TaxID=683041 RepID=A0ABW0IKW4_9BACT
MPSNALTQHTIDATLHMLKSGNESVASPNEGASVIDNWIKVLQDSKPGSNVLDQLMQLRSLLQMPDPDTDQVKQLLDNLADHTTQMAQSSEGPWINELEQIVVALRNFSNQL